MNRGPLAASGLVAAVCAAMLAGCGDDAGAPTSSPEQTVTASPPQGERSDHATTKENAMRIELTVDGERFHATLDDSAASRDLLDQLPQRVEMRDHGGVEKTGRLRSALSVEGQPPGADPAVGDVGYYAPGRDLVLYYGDQSYYDGIIVLGHLDGGAAERIARMDGDVTVTVDAIS